MLENEEQDGGTNRKAKAKQGTRKTMDTFNGGLYCEVTINSQKGCNPSSL